jgi:pimeloyl-ACP methyl ester carboxylesterase
VETVTRVVATGDGRELCVEQTGDLSGRVVLVHWGTPNSRHHYGPAASWAASEGIRLVSYDRPGYGRSSSQPGRTVADCVPDVRAVADALGADRLVVWGISGGGPHALACAALLPDRVAAVATLASPAPFGASGLDYFAGMGTGNADDIRLLLRDRDGARAKWKLDREELLAAPADQMAQSLRTLLSPADRAVLTGEFVDWMMAGFRDGLAPGDQGWWDDSVALRTRWGFDVGMIGVPVQVWHGRHDRFVPFQHGQWLAEHVPGAQPQLSDHDGHLTLLEKRIPEVHRWLLGHL